ncbi:MAG TPA: transporter substrate-binding domain-containing protein [Azospirillaceae bacterium]|nr:transporter substrate-binding domain-containing protein [Azospirillaceae bacterium]
MAWNALTRCALLIGTAAALLAGEAAAAEVKIVAPELPPMMDRSGKGREAEIIGETLASCGHTATFSIRPFGRHWQDYSHDTSFDVVSTVPGGMDLPGFRSTDYIQYQNGASILKSSGMSVASLADLAGKRAVTFQGGKEILPGLKDAAANFADLQEKADQLLHSNLLFAKRVDAVLGDGLVFAEYNRQLQNKTASALSFDPNQEVVFTAIFPPSSYALVFRTEGLRDDFNRCYADLVESGRIDAINRNTVETYRATVGNQYLRY